MRSFGLLLVPAELSHPSLIFPAQGRLTPLFIYARLSSLRLAHFHSADGLRRVFCAQRGSLLRGRDALLPQPKIKDFRPGPPLTLV